AVSGASSATCAVIGKLAIPAMEQQGYPRAFGAALAACSGTTGALIPPSIVLLLYGTITSTSVEELFLGGVMPGVLVGVGLMISSYFYVRRHGIPAVAWVGPRGMVRAFREGLLPLGMILIIFGGIFGGFFTATEASVVAVVYAMIVSLVVLRELRLRDLPEIFITAGKTTAVLSFLIAGAVLFAKTLAIGQLPQAIAAGLLAMTGSV